MNAFSLLCSGSFIRKKLRAMFTVQHPLLQRSFFGIAFPNPVGLGAGFDKNARYLRELQTLGFGFVEIGTVTPRPQTGNKKPRLFRLPKDYEICFTALHPYVDFFVVNVSSPNTPGLRALQEKEALKKILMHLQQLNKNLAVQKPILLKIAPDLTFTQLDDVIHLATEIMLDGLVAVNTTISREGLETVAEDVQQAGTGGLSGRPLQNRATQVVQYIAQKTGGALPVIGSGGIFTAADAAQKLSAGAALLEVWTGFIYEGPFIVRNICHHLKNKGAAG